MKDVGGYVEEYNAFAQQLRETGIYETPKRGKARGVSSLNSILFHVQNVANVLRSARVAKATGGLTDEQWGQTSFNVIRIAENRGAHVSISGARNCVLREGPMVFICNHMSLLESFFLAAITTLGGHTSFVVKEALTNYPVFRHVINSTQPITVGRENAREDLKAVLRGGKDLLAGGRSVVIFPQSTRTNVFSDEEFNTLGSKLASKAGTPIIPVAVKTDFLGNGKFHKDFGKIDPSKTIHIEFGAPVDSARPRDSHDEVVSFIKARLERWGAV